MRMIAKNEPHNAPAEPLDRSRSRFVLRRFDPDVSRDAVARDLMRMRRSSAALATPPSMGARRAGTAVPTGLRCRRIASRPQRRDVGQRSRRAARLPHLARLPNPEDGSPLDGAYISGQPSLPRARATSPSGTGEPHRLEREVNRVEPYSCKHHSQSAASREQLRRRPVAAAIIREPVAAKRIDLHGSMPSRHSPCQRGCKRKQRAASTRGRRTTPCISKFVSIL